MRKSLLLLALATSSLFAQNQKPIDIEMVRKELLSKPHLAPDDLIKKSKPAMFKAMYAGNLCFVHLQQSSDFMVYRITDGTWAFENLLKAWSNIDLVDPTLFIFLADVQSCEPNGECKTYKSLSRYDGKGLLVLREYSGFDKTLYYKKLNDAGNPDKVKFAIGDTITRIVTLSDFRFEQYQASFTLNRKSETISYISKAGIKKKVVVDNFQRIIVNH